LDPGGNLLAMGGGWRESGLRKSPQPLALKQVNGRASTVVSAHPGGISDILFLNGQDFLSAASDELVNWHCEPSLDKIYYRLKKFDGTAIRKIIRGPGNTILIQADHALLHYDLDKEAVVDSIYVKQPVSAISVNTTSGQVVYAVFNTLVFTNLSSWHTKRTTIPLAHSDRITSIDFNPTHPTVATCSWDATVKLWDADSIKLLATIISIGSNDHIIITPDNYYYGTKNSLNGIGFKYGKEFISPEQYDLHFNRPDIVLERIGYVSKQIVKSFNRAYQKRLQKMNFTEQMLSEEIHMPTLELESGALPLNSSSDNITFTVKANDTKYKLDRINVFVNNVPVYGLNGISLRGENVSDISHVVSLRLSAGRNKIQVSSMNEKGVESLLQTAEVTYHPAHAVRPNLYLAVISVSRYANASMNLKYARKDGQDIVSQFKKAGWYENVYVDTLFDQRATLENIQQLRDFFSKAGTDDEVLFFVSGHGLLDQNLDFYFGTHDIDFKYPSRRGLRYEELEGLLDGIPARKKVLLIDACHSGEIDKSRIQAVQLTADLGKNHKGTVTTYTYPSDIENDNYKVGITTSFELMQEIFANVTKGSGAIVISAAAGNSYALESDEWRNGVFTFALLSGLKNRRADDNGDRSISVTELKRFVSDEVENLTHGAQRPTSRSENLEFDFRVW
ncbi:MAG TPA: caspase family protein, partial [Chryseosolibacter sp.]